MCGGGGGINAVKLVRGEEEEEEDLGMNGCETQ